jgi:23S rRNA-intervening sequence protein
MLYQELPVYKSSYDLLMSIFTITKTLPRQYKFVMGEKLQSLCVDMIISIYQANSDREKRRSVLGHLRVRIETIRLLLRVMKDQGILPLVSFIAVSSQVEEISKQVVGWEKGSGR